MIGSLQDPLLKDCYRWPFWWWDKQTSI